MERPTVKGIRDLKTQLESFYSMKIALQGEEQGYYDDIFPVNIKQPYHIIRTGSAARIVDTLTAQIVTSNPQVFREPRKSGRAEEERCTKVSKLLNHWIVTLVDEIEEGVKNAGIRGEVFWQIEYNEDYKPDDGSLPIIFSAPDPMIIFADPHEVNGIPRRVIKSCKMAVGQVEQQFPNWKNPKGRKPDDPIGVDYLAYFDKDWRYFEADEEPLLKGEIQKNVLGFTPFIHDYSGLGKRSPEGKPETKAVGYLRKPKGALVEECEMESRIDSIIALFGNPAIVLKPKEGAESISDEEKKAIELVPGAVIVLPSNYDFEIRQGDVPSAGMFQHLYQIKARLGIETPPVALGMPSTSGESGRQADIYYERFSRKYSRLVDNISRSLARALGLGLRVLDTIPGIFPITVRATTLEDGKQIRKEETLTQKDIDGYYGCKVELRAEDELTQDRKLMMYRLLAGENRVSWKTLLVEGMGKTEEEAENEINETLAELAWRTNPMLLNVILQEALEQAGMGRYLEQAAREAEAQAGTGTPPPAESPRPSEARNPLASGATRQMLQESPFGVRQSSAGYRQGE